MWKYSITIILTLLLISVGCSEYTVTINEDNSVTSAGKKSDKTII